MQREYGSGSPFPHVAVERRDGWTEFIAERLAFAGVTERQFEEWAVSEGNLRALAEIARRGGVASGLAIDARLALENENLKKEIGWLRAKIGYYENRMSDLEDRIDVMGSLIRPLTVVIEERTA